MTRSTRTGTDSSIFASLWSSFGWKPPGRTVETPVSARVPLCISRVLSVAEKAHYYAPDNEGRICCCRPSCSRRERRRHDSPSTGAWSGVVVLFGPCVCQPGDAPKRRFLIRNSFASSSRKVKRTEETLSLGKKGSRRTRPHKASPLNATGLLPGRQSKASTIDFKRSSEALLILKS